MSRSRGARGKREGAADSSVVDGLERAVKAPGFKHLDFWNGEWCVAVARALTARDFEKAGARVGRISPEEAQAALDDYDE